ncbi:Hypothetical_protein [Hexamita inflata]|uniref:Hypothetical_protein n=1 Tax=Hexamita inflata TaxID=28002 RepID=A0AA86V213_9EUKA|nr:Hypothetical protein HINF_LOCUS60871 [Hexamita inflata]
MEQICFHTFIKNKRFSCIEISLNSQIAFLGHFVFWASQFYFINNSFSLLSPSAQFTFIFQIFSSCYPIHFWKILEILLYYYYVAFSLTYKGFKSNLQQEEQLRKGLFDVHLYESE